MAGKTIIRFCSALMAIAISHVAYPDRIRLTIATKGNTATITTYSTAFTTPSQKYSCTINCSVDSTKLYSTSQNTIQYRDFNVSNSDYVNAPATAGSKIFAGWYSLPAGTPDTESAHSTYYFGSKYTALLSSSRTTRMDAIITNTAIKIGVYATGYNAHIAAVYRTPATYTITYVPDQFSDQTASVTQAKTENTALSLKGAIFTRRGYYQSGWTVAEGGGIVYSLGESYTANAPITLYPCWELMTYKLSLMPQGGAFAPSSSLDSYGVYTNYCLYDTTALANMETVISNMIPPSNGRIFAGFWTRINDGELTYAPSGMAVSGTVFSASSKTVAHWIATNNITLYAHWMFPQFNKIHLHGYSSPSHYIPYKAGIK